jgi:hypothetical protein
MDRGFRHAGSAIRLLTGFTLRNARRRFRHVARTLRVWCAEENLMTKSQNNLRFRPFLIALAAVAGIATGACREDNGDEYEPPQKVVDACGDYCARANDCNDETDVDKCQADCVDAMTDCMVDELDAALTKLNQCANESCDDFIGCSVCSGCKPVTSRSRAARSARRRAEPRAWPHREAGGPRHRGPRVRA